MNSLPDNLESAAQHADRHGWDIRSRWDARRALVPKIDVVSAAGLGGRAHQAPAKQVGKRRVFDRAYNLAAVEAKGRQHFDEMKRAEIVDMLDRIIEKE